MNSNNRETVEQKSWIDAFSPLASLEPFARREIETISAVVIPKGAVLFAPGTPCTGFAIVLEGCIRVGLTAANGRALTLYRVVSGETCIQTTLCLLGENTYSTEGRAETSLRLVLVPASLFRRLLRDSQSFSHFVFASFAARLADMTRIIETAAFARLDARLAATLLARAGEGDTAAATHQNLADDIGAAREAVSRQLAAFQKADLVRLSREVVTLIDKRALADLAM